PKLAYTAEAGRIRAIMVPRKIPWSGNDVIMRLMSLAAVDILPEEMRHLYGYWWSPLHRGLLGLATNGLLRSAVKKTPYERVLPGLREHARVHAFGTRALKINKDLRSSKSVTPTAATPDAPPSSEQIPAPRSTSRQGRLPSDPTGHT